MIEVQQRDSITILRLNRGPVNALDSELLVGLSEALDEAERSAARALVLTGAGSSFSAGVDLWRVLEGGAPYLESFVPDLTRSLARLFSFPRPVVAALNGHAIAGGCVLALACDHRIMVGGASIGVPELRVGVPFPAVAFEVVRSALSPDLYKRLVYLGEVLDADAALAVGLIDEVSAPNLLDDHAVEVAYALAAIPADTFRLTKMQRRGPVLERAEAKARETDAEVARIWASDEVMRAIREHMEAVRDASSHA